MPVACETGVRFTSGERHRHLQHEKNKQKCGYVQSLRGKTPLMSAEGMGNYSINQQTVGSGYGI